MREIYADHAATTRPAPEVVTAMLPYLGDRFGNASSVHRRGEAARDAVDAARAQVAALAGALPEQVVLTASGSESNNLALKGAWGAWAARGTPARRRIVVSAIEHPSVLETARHLASRGAGLTIVPVDRRGVVDLASLESALGPDVALVSVQWVNNEVGAIQPVREIAARARAHGAWFHCDAVQAAGKLALEEASGEFDLMSLAAHKIEGPLGAAALVIGRQARLIPLIHGGHQERGRRAGTENLAALVGFGVAAERARSRLAGGEAARVAALGLELERRLLAAVPGARLNGDPSLRAASIVNVCFPGADGEAVLHELDRSGITVSTGSACSAMSEGPSHVLLAMGLAAEDAHASVRFSLGEGNRAEDVETITNAVTEALARLRGLAGAGSPGVERGHERRT